MFTKSIQSMYQWVKSLSDQPWALWALAVIAFAESSFFPIPPDLLLVPLVLGAVDATSGRKVQWWVYPLVCTAASVLGGIAGYGIGALFMDQLGEPILKTLGYEARFERLLQLYQEHGIALVLVAGLTPIPYKVFTLASGAAGMNLGLFTAASILARGLRFFALAILLRLLGPRFEQLPPRLFAIVTVGLAILAVVGYYLYKSLGA